MAERTLPRATSGANQPQHAAAEPPTDGRPSAAEQNLEGEADMNMMTSIKALTSVAATSESNHVTDEPAPADYPAALKAYEAAAAPLRTKGLSDDEIDRLSDVEGEALVALYASPAPDLEAVATKLRVYSASRYSEDAFLSSIQADIARLKGSTVTLNPSSGDAELLAAWPKWQEGITSFIDLPGDSEEGPAKEAYARWQGAAKFIEAATPTTLAGGIIKLRVLLSNLVTARDLNGLVIRADDAALRSHLAELDEDNSEEDALQIAQVMFLLIDTLRPTDPWGAAMANHERAKATASAFDAPFHHIEDAYKLTCSALPTDVPDQVSQAQRREIAAEFGYDAAVTKYDALCGAVSNAQSALITMPAPDADALLWKLEVLHGEEERGHGDRSGLAWCAAYLDAVMADARRLLPQQAAL